MRQAGRYHSHYQALKKNYTFEELCKKPYLAAETALGPIEDFDFDVAILFSDILFPLQSMGLDLKYQPGPIFKEFLSEKHLKIAKPIDEIIGELSFQADALRLTRKKLPANKSLVGFVGGPWTLLSFATGIKNEIQIKKIHQNYFYEKLLYENLIPIIYENIKLQFDSGAEIVYIFDTNAVQLDQQYFLDKYLPELKTSLFTPFKKQTAYFTKNKHINALNNINKNFDLAGHVYNSNIDFSLKLNKNTNGFIQGNFSPESLLKPHARYRADFNIFIQELLNLSPENRQGWICSLSHGILPKTPEENVRHFINGVRESFNKG